MHTWLDIRIIPPQKLIPSTFPKWISGNKLKTLSLFELINFVFDFRRRGRKAEKFLLFLKLNYNLRSFCLFSEREIDKSWFIHSYKDESITCIVGLEKRLGMGLKLWLSCSMTQPDPETFPLHVSFKMLQVEKIFCNKAANQILNIIFATHKEDAFTWIPIWFNLIAHRV